MVDVLMCREVDCERRVTISLLDRLLGLPGGVKIAWLRVTALNRFVRLAEGLERRAVKQLVASDDSQSMCAVMVGD